VREELMLAADMLVKDEVKKLYILAFLAFLLLLLLLLLLLQQLIILCDLSWRMKNF
jgi:hypothetical protein